MKMPLEDRKLGLQSVDLCLRWATNQYRWFLCHESEASWKWKTLSSLVLTTNNQARYNEHKVLFSSTEYPPKVSKLNRFHPNDMYLSVSPKKNFWAFSTHKTICPKPTIPNFSGPLFVVSKSPTVLSKHRGGWLLGRWHCSRRTVKLVVDVNPWSRRRWKVIVSSAVTSRGFWAVWRWGKWVFF